MESLRAPGRGRHDRARSRAQRQLEQHERLLAAVAQVLAAGELSLAAIVRVAGVGRNTFYEFFDDVAHAEREVRARALRAVDGALEQAIARGTNAQARIAALGESWFGAFEEETLAPLALARPAAGELSPAGLALARRLNAVRGAQVATEQHERADEQRREGQSEVGGENTIRGEERTVGGDDGGREPEAEREHESGEDELRCLALAGAAEALAWSSMNEGRAAWVRRIFLEMASHLLR